MYGIISASSWNRSSGIGCLAWCLVPQSPYSEKIRFILPFLPLGIKKLGVLGLIPASLLGIASPLCMYGTIPIAASFSQKGMKDDSASAFMITGPATKITNLGALKIVLGARRFALYLAFVMLLALAAGLLVDLTL